MLIEGSRHFVFRSGLNFLPELLFTLENHMDNPNPQSPHQPVSPAQLHRDFPPPWLSSYIHEVGAVFTRHSQSEGLLDS